MTILEEVEVGLGKDNTHVALEGMTKAVADQGQEPALLEVESGVLIVKNMTILPMTFECENRWTC